MFSIDFTYVYNIIQSKNYYIIQVSVFKKMKKFLPLILLTGFSSPVLADITHRMTSSTQLITNAAATQTSAGGAYSFSQSFIQGDVIETTAPAVGAVSDYSSQISTAVGSGTGTGTVTSGHTVTAVGGGSGTSSIGQFVTELTIK